MIPLYSERGYRVQIDCTPDKAILFRAAGAEIVDAAPVVHDWFYPPEDVPAQHDRRGTGNKSAGNLSRSPLPDIGSRFDLWQDYCQTRVRPIELVAEPDRSDIARWLDRLPRPVVLLHTIGNTDQRGKSLPNELTESLYRELLDRTEGGLVLLDWDRRVPRLAHGRVRHLDDLPGGCSTERMMALMDQADLLVGVDSGPLHACGLTDTPSVGLWRPGHYPARYALPDRNRLNITVPDKRNRYHRGPWRIIEHPGTEFAAGRLADWIASMLGPPRYLPEHELAADIQMRHWIGDWCRGGTGNSLSTFSDRNHSFDVTFRRLSARHPWNPRIVETGCIRAEEDWPGAGFFSYLAGHYVSHRNGQLDSVDLDPGHCDFARTWCAEFGRHVRVHASDSLAYLNNRQEPIDLLYCDSLDTYEPNHAAHALAEVEAAMPLLHESSLILFDDSPWNAGAITGKAARAVPWLLDHGWRIRYAGYQVLLEKDGNHHASD